MTPRRGGPPPGDRREVEALVLSCVDADAHRIARLLTSEGEVVPVIARHGRRTSARRSSDRLQPLTRVTATVALRPSDDLARISGATLVEELAVLKGDLRRFGLASTMAEVVLTTVPDFATEEGLYELVLRAWRWLDSPDNAPVEEVLLLFELRALQLSGALPPLAELPGLGDRARRGLAAWSSGQWGLLAPADVRAVANALEGLIYASSGRRLKSRAFLDEVLSEKM
ncbi:MAG: hypothetical protein EP329_24380 [Deltaproteobacteria bacterium]|nr:MAG: hypothetical protein EP329_24380 [Deltaproteobacteria bacterium]